MVVTSGTLSVKVNDVIGSYFQSGKGVRQGDPLSPLLFNLVADALAKIIQQAQRNGLIQGLIPEYMENGIAILQYADDTILCLQDEDDSAQNMKPLLYLFEQMSGLKINFDKSEIFCFGQAKEMEHHYSQLFGCQSGMYTFRYLGIPMHFRKLRNADWRIVEEKFEKKLSSWKGKHMSVGGRLVLINSVLTSLAMFMLSFFEVPKQVLERLDYYRSIFFWQ